VKFRDDIDPKNTWVTSDTHFGHDNIVGFCLRPEDHEQAMIAEWRSAVPEDATLIHLGDLCYRGNGRFKNITAKELTPYTHLDAPKPHLGRKLLIQGNHDRQRYSFYKQSGFNIVKPFAIKWAQVEEGCPCYDIMGEYRVSFSHYDWNAEEDGPMQVNDWRIHGHIHNNGYTRDGFVPFLRNHINISVEQTHYRPVNLELLLNGAILGRFPETTQEQLDEAQARRDERKESNVR
jgi:calcineurin-like phosphoesterase family protein